LRLLHHHLHQQNQPQVSQVSYQIYLPANFWWKCFQLIIIYIQECQISKMIYKIK
jgi:hypothetical protein